jgi:hypothetical protein
MKTKEQIEADARELLLTITNRGDADLAETFKEWITENYFGKTEAHEALSLLTIALLMIVSAAEHANQVALRTLTKLIMAQSNCSYGECYLRAQDLVQETVEEVEAQAQARTETKQ